MRSLDIDQEFIDACPASMAIIAPDGRIERTNTAWRKLRLDASGGTHPYGMGANYFDVCKALMGDASSEAHVAVAGIRAVLAGERPSLKLDYPCRPLNGHSWFHMSVTPILKEAKRFALITQFDISEHIKCKSQLTASVKKRRALVQRHSRKQKISIIAQSVTRWGDWEMDLHSGRMRLSAEAIRILEIDAADQTRDALLSAVYLQDRAAVSAAIDASLATGEVTSIDFRVVRADGRLKYVNSTWQVAKAPEDVSGRAIGAFQDISERQALNDRLRQSEQNLRQSRIHLAIAQRLASIGSAAIDFRTNKWDWSDENFRLYGLEPGAIVPSAETLAALVHPEDRAQLLSSVPLARSGKTPAPLEYRIIRPDGVERLLRREAALVHDELGQVIGIVGAVQDITDLRAAQNARKESEDRLKEQAAMLSNAQRLGRMGSWSINLRDGRLNWSDATCEIFGITPGEFEGTFEHFRSFVLPEDIPAQQEAIARVTREHPLLEAQYRIRRPDGTVRWLHERGSVLFDQADNPVSRIGMVSDVTELRNLESQLRDVMRMDVIGQLTGGLAHDFNNLLSVILGSADTLVSELEPASPLYPTARLIMRASERGADLTSRLLAFARRQPLAPRITDINKLLLAMQPLLRRTIESNVEIVWECDPDLCFASIDPPQLENALLNLCLNARDAMPDGGCITIRTRNADDNRVIPGAEAGHFVHIAVSDTGVGMTEDTLAHVFEPFFTTKRAGRGNGLGLSMVHGFINQSGGHILIDSQPGGGTTVNVYLPVAVGDPEQIVAESASQVSRGRRERVLLVEDDPMVRGHVRGMLERLNYRVTEAPDAPTALRALVRADFSLLLTDIVLPGGMDGQQLAEAARRHSPRLGILLTTGYAQGLLNRKAWQDRGFLLLSKPYRIGELGAMVSRAIRTRQNTKS